MDRLDKEIKMSLKAKVAIFLLATLVTLTGFNLIASSSALDILKMGKRAGYGIIANVLAETTQPAHRS
jgi:predicted exporter